MLIAHIILVLLALKYLTLTVTYRYTYIYRKERTLKNLKIHLNYPQNLTINSYSTIPWNLSVPNLISTKVPTALRCLAQRGSARDASMRCFVRVVPLSSLHAMCSAASVFARLLGYTVKVRGLRRTEKRNRERRPQGPRATTTSAQAHDSAGHTPPPPASALGGAVQGSSTEMVTVICCGVSIYSCTLCSLVLFRPVIELGFLIR
jgi:hypothetical protein